MNRFYHTILVSLLCLLNISSLLSQNGNWVKLSLPQGIRIDQIAFNSKGEIFISTWWYPDSAVIGGTIDRIERSIDHGNSWATVFKAGEVWITIALDSADNLYAGTLRDVFKSSDNGVRWDTLVDTLPISFVHAIGFDRNGFIFIGANSLNFRSKDNGKHWQQMSLEYQAEEFLFLKNGDILAGVNTGYFPNPPQYIYRSTDGGDSWQKVLNAEKTFGWSFVASDNGAVFAATAEYDSTLGGVYKSTNNGVSWSRVNNGLPSRKISSLTIGSTGKLFASIAGYGVFQSTDYGDSWTDFTNGLDDLRIASLMMSPNDQLFVGTGPAEFPTPQTLSGSLNYCNTITSVSLLNSASQIGSQLAQNYPNPFNPVTTISFTLSSESFVSLKIYDLMGRELSTLVSEKLNPGFYTRHWNAENMPSGVYLYRLQSEKYVQTKKLILIK